MNLFTWGRDWLVYSWCSTLFSVWSLVSSRHIPDTLSDLVQVWSHFWPIYKNIYFCQTNSSYQLQFTLQFCSIYIKEANSYTPISQPAVSLNTSNCLSYLHCKMINVFLTVFCKYILCFVCGFFMSVKTYQLLNVLTLVFFFFFGVVFSSTISSSFDH